MIARIAATGAACALLVIVLIGAATTAALGTLTAPLTGTGNTATGTATAPSLDAAQFCALGAITPGKDSGYGTYTTDQIANATTIYQASVGLGLPPYAAVIAIATALQESNLYNLDYGDQDSVGLFQQRPSQGWGTYTEIMDPTYAATRFYEALINVPNWQTIPLYQAAQTVQKSAYPTAYAAHQNQAEYLVATVSGTFDNCPAAKQ